MPFPIPPLETITKWADGIYNSVKGPIRLRIEKFKSEIRVSKLGSYAKKIDLVRTIYQPEKPVSLQRIYFPATLVHKDISVIDNTIDFSQDKFRAILFQGTAGHGKSFLLKFLCLRELSKGLFIPLLIFLRDIDEAESIFSKSLTELENLGISGDARILIQLFKEGRVILFLDGFDEVPENLKDDRVYEITRLLRKFPRLRISVSSRPNSGILGVVELEVFNFSPISRKEQVNFINFIMHESDEKTALVSEIKRTSSFLSEVTVTPLYLTLLIIAFRAESRVPENLVDFYKLLFPTMLLRHDNLKIGYKRERKSNLSEADLEIFFEIFCFVSMAGGLVTLDRLTLQKSALLAIKHTTGKADQQMARHSVDDIVKITCLIIEDGYEAFSFVHKTIQEYFSAAFLRRSDESTRLDYYRRMLIDLDTSRANTQVLHFLSGLDPHLYSKHFEYILIARFLSKSGVIKECHLKRIFGKRSVIVFESNGEVADLRLEEGFFLFLNREIRQMFEYAVRAFFDKKKAETVKYLYRSNIVIHEVALGHLSGENITIRQVLDDMALWESLIHYVDKFMKQDIIDYVSSVQGRIKLAEKRHGLLDLAKIQSAY